MREKRKMTQSPSVERSNDRNPHDRLVLRLERLRDAACEAVLWEDTNKIAWVAKSFANIVPTREALLSTGVGHLLTDKHIWQMGGELAVIHANKAVEAYKAAAKVSLDSRGSSAKPVPNGLANLPAKSFMALVKDLEAWLLKVDATPADTVSAKRLAALLVQNGFRHWSHLDSAGGDCIPVKVPCQAALLVRAVKKATLLGQRERSRASGVEEMVVSSASGSSVSNMGRGTAGSSAKNLHMSSAEMFASSLSPAHFEACQQAWEAQCSELQLFDAGATPTAVISQVGKSRVQPSEIRAVLETRAAQLRLGTKKGSLKAVASGLRAWHTFAETVLEYPANATLPPRSPDDICCFISVFVNAGTAANYVGYIRWTCLQLELSVLWWTPAVTMTLKGLKVDQLARTGGPSITKFLLPDTVVAQLSALSSVLKEPMVQSLVLVSYIFLLRVQSEGLGLQRGCPGDASVLPPGRHRAVWAGTRDCGKPALFIRLARRKTGPKGPC